jgi:sigma-B regulation protein RsbU (phosphoserine phosphatase)
MLSAAGARVLFCAEAISPHDDVRTLLAGAGHHVVGHPLVNGIPSDLIAFDLVVIDGGGDRSAALRLCRRLRLQLADDFVPILLVTDDTSPSARFAGLEHGADAYLLRPFSPEELQAQANAFLRLRQMHRRLREKTAEVQQINKRLHDAHQQLNDELELARRIQRSFLPQSLPVMPPAHFAVSYRPCGRVGGDFYDVFRLDEEHIGFYVADAMGHGVPASLLTIFVKKGVKAKDIFGQQYRLVPPDEVLGRLNRDLLDQELSDQPFITMVYALFNCRDYTLRLARAGHPYPLYVPHDAEPRLWQVDGTLLGVFETQFIVQSHQLRPGDKVLLYTDGVEPSHGPSVERLVATVSRHREHRVGEFIDLVARDLLGSDRVQDDFTLLGLEVRA